MEDPSVAFALCAFLRKIREIAWINAHISKEYSKDRCHRKMVRKSDPSFHDNPSFFY